ncbi:MarR family winged helix-turn-helix transcriptional regulator [Zhihengliuella halotolerans]|uniref:MarR family winged helix-turn-helix transcriptional regulator n=1 Tax=Zhihengliuella halotolerans TaxID=370736 RepID=UPI000C7FD80E|nr:MarR family transcriptional regulator [Zhihengliuella halotolerans]
MNPPTSASGLDTEQLEIWAAVATLLERLPAALDAQLQRDSDLTHFEHGLLFALGAAPDRALRMSQLAGYANCTLSRLSRAVTRLEKKGLVRRAVDEIDGRVSKAVLTDDGEEMLRQATPAHHALVKRLVFDPLTEAQTRKLGAISREINTAIDPAEVWKAPTERGGVG